METYSMDWPLMKQFLEENLLNWKPIKRENKLINCIVQILYNSAIKLLSSPSLAPNTDQFD